MLITHLHFNRNCYNAIQMYEKAFDTKTDVCYFKKTGDTSKIVIHAEMKIHDIKIMLNDSNTREICSEDSRIHLIITFSNENELKQCYSKMSDNSETIYPLQKTDYSDCIVDFVDKYGIRWGFMVQE